MRNASAMDVTPERRRSSLDNTEIAAGASPSFCSLLETEVTVSFINCSRLMSASDCLALLALNDICRIERASKRCLRKIFLKMSSGSFCRCGLETNNSPRHAAPKVFAGLFFMTIQDDGTPLQAYCVIGESGLALERYCRVSRSANRPETSVSARPISRTPTTSERWGSSGCD